MTLASKAAEVLRIMSDDTLEQETVKAARVIAESLESGKKVLACGNGGSFADADHFVAELTGKLSRLREPKAALLLGSSGAAATAISNDFGFENVFSRELRGVGSVGDVLVCFSTSGTSQNVVNAAIEALDIGVTVLTFSSKSKSPLSEASDIALGVDSLDTQTIQECHGILMHYLCELLDRIWIG